MKALIFDFDGLILDTETPELATWQEIYAEHGVEMPLGYWGGLVGRGVNEEYERPAELLARLTGKPVMTSQEHQVIRDRIIAKIDCLSARPGVTELLDECQSQRFPIAVASSSKHIWVDTHLIRLGLYDHFQAIVCADDVERGKPFPDLYLAACKALDVLPSDALALEDSRNGITAALAAKMRVAVIPNPVTESLDLSQATYRFPTFEGLTLARLRELE